MRDQRPQLHRIVFGYMTGLLLNHAILYRCLGMPYRQCRLLCGHSSDPYARLCLHHIFLHVCSEHVLDLVFFCAVIGTRNVYNRLSGILRAQALFSDSVFLPSADTAHADQSSCPKAPWIIFARQVFLRASKTGRKLLSQLLLSCLQDSSFRLLPFNCLSTNHI
jgi:hypothetical protein